MMINTTWVLHDAVRCRWAKSKGCIAFMTARLLLCRALTLHLRPQWLLLPRLILLLAHLAHSCLMHQVRTTFPTPNPQHLAMRRYLMVYIKPRPNPLPWPLVCLCLPASIQNLNRRQLALQLEGAALLPAYPRS